MKLSKEERKQAHKELRNRKREEDQKAEDIYLLNLVPNISYVIYGSSEGDDIDVALVVDKSLEKLKIDKLNRLSYLLSKRLQINDARDINVNPVVVEDGIVTWAAHGVSWQTNNAIFATFKLHELNVGKRNIVERFVKPSDYQKNMKIHRAVRALLSMVTRTINYRELAKKYLRPDVSLRDRMYAVSLIDCKSIIWEDNIETKEHLKRGCYQTIQTICVLDDNEQYTKQGLNNYSNGELYAFLFRKPPTVKDYDNLTKYIKILLKMIENRVEIDLNKTELHDGIDLTSCRICGAVKDLSYCGKCKSAIYCDAKCQSFDESHSSECFIGNDLMNLPNEVIENVVQKMNGDSIVQLAKIDLNFAAWLFAHKPLFYSNKLSSENFRILYGFKNEAFNKWYFKEYVVKNIIDNNGHIFYNDKKDYVHMKYTPEKFDILFSDYKDIFKEVYNYDMDMINRTPIIFRFGYAQKDDVEEFVLIAFENGFY